MKRGSCSWVVVKRPRRKRKEALIDAVDVNKDNSPEEDKEGRDLDCQDLFNGLVSGDLSSCNLANPIAWDRDCVVMLDSRV